MEGEPPVGERPATGKGERVSVKRNARPGGRHPRPPLERAELIAYNWGGRLFEVDPERVGIWFITRQRPDRNMSDDEHYAWDELDFERWWFYAWSGFNDAAEHDAASSRES